MVSVVVFGCDTMRSGRCKPDTAVPLLRRLSPQRELLDAVLCGSERGG